MTYTINPPINVHEPSCSGDNCLVTMMVNTKPVMILSNPITNEIKPEYVTLMLDMILQIRTIGLI
ncbi:hypothetical protein [Nitrosopumilus sp.]|uniref:hypothetical protein n=1 Tax=Nitrosopumilus sp. TaxID=2024843 RepID=UPI003B5A3DE4